MLFLPARPKWINWSIYLMKNRLLYDWRGSTVLLSNAGSSLDNRVVRWCCISNAELRKCEEWALSIKSDPLVCVQATSMASCIEMIKVGESLWLYADYMIICTECMFSLGKDKWKNTSTLEGAVGVTGNLCRGISNQWRSTAAWLYN